MSPLRETMLHEMQRRNYSSRTISSYLSCLAALSQYYDQSPDTISPDQFKAYLHDCIQESKCSKSTINQSISVYKILYQDILHKDWPAIRLVRPKRERRLPVVLSRKEVFTLVNAPTNLKHRAILHLGYSAGLRISEVIALTPEDIDSARMQIRVIQAKGRKDRYTILSQHTLELLRAYYRRYRPGHYLFEGQYPPAGPYSRTSIHKIIKRAAGKAGISKPVSFHTLRHCFATHLLEQGTSLHIIQFLLGHNHIRTTSMYLHIQQYALDKVVSPLDLQA